MVATVIHTRCRWTADRLPAFPPSNPFFPIPRRRWVAIREPKCIIIAEATRGPHRHTNGHDMLRMPLNANSHRSVLVWFLIGAVPRADER